MNFVLKGSELRNEFKNLEWIGVRKRIVHLQTSSIGLLLY